jgi:hypothetical protein
MRRYKRRPHNLFYFWVVANAVIDHCLFSIREATSAAMIADDTPAVTGASPEVQKLMTACGGAMYITSCVSTESTAHEHSANAVFDEAALRL